MARLKQHMKPKNLGLLCPEDQEPMKLVKVLTDGKSGGTMKWYCKCELGYC